MKILPTPTPQPWYQVSPEERRYAITAVWLEKAPASVLFAPANFTLSAMQSGAHILSTLHAFGKMSAVYKNFGRTIRCQPTALSRRRAHQPRGCALVAKDRPPSCIKAGRKRKRNLASNVVLGMMHQSSCIQVTRTVKALLKWPLLLHTSNSLLGGRG